MEPLLGVGREIERLPLQNVPMPSERWALLGACRTDPDPAAWFSDSKRRRNHAKAVCAEDCPVRAPCLAFALKHPGLRGIWGASSYQWRDRKLKEGRGK